jgi:hypothetical protein
MEPVKSFLSFKYIAPGPSSCWWGRPLLGGGAMKVYFSRGQGRSLRCGGSNSREKLLVEL